MSSFHFLTLFMLLNTERTNHLQSLQSEISNNHFGRGKDDRMVGNIMRMSLQCLCTADALSGE